jgi:hypothetical protein
MLHILRICNLNLRKTANTSIKMILRKIYLGIGKHKFFYADFKFVEKGKSCSISKIFWEKCKKKKIPNLHSFLVTFFKILTEDLKSA